MREDLIFDSHAHYDDSRFRNYEIPRDQLLENLFSTDVAAIVNVGTNLRNAQTSIELTRKYENMYCAIGIYPGDIPGGAEVMEETVGRLEKLIYENEKVVAIGEIGLDYHYDDVPRDIQKLWFERQMELARKIGYPVAIHDREAHGDCLDIVKGFKDVTGVFHCFSGSVEMAKELLKLGYYVSISGVVTFSNARVLKEVVREVPIERMLVETDCPYLAPTPHRGKTNHSGYIKYIIETIADIKGMKYEDVCRITNANARQMYKIK